MHKHSLWGDILDAVACVGGHEINVDVVAQFVHIDRKHRRLVRRHGALEASGHAATRHRERSEALDRPEEVEVCLLFQGAVLGSA